MGLNFRCEKLLKLERILKTVLLKKDNLTRKILIEGQQHTAQYGPEKECDVCLQIRTRKSDKKEGRS